MSNAEFTVKLTDKVSGPARSASNAVEHFGTSITRLKAGMPALSNSFVRGAKGASDWRTQASFAAKAANRLAVSQRGVASSSGGLSAGGVAFGNILARMGEMATRAAFAIARVAAQISVAFAGAVIGAAMKADQFMFSLTKFLGSKEKASAEMKNLTKISNELGISFDDAATSFKGFVSAGMSPDAARDMVKFRADLQAVATSDKDLERLAEAFLQIEKATATGRLEMDGFTSILAGLPGVTETSVFEKLGPMMGKTVEELKKIEKTKLPVDKLLKAMQEAFLEATKKSTLGATAAEKAVMTLGGAWDNLKNRAGNMLMAIGQKLIPILSKKLMPVVEGLLAALDSPEAGKVVDAIVDSFAAMADSIASAWKSMGGAEGATKMLDSLASGIENATKLVGSFGEGLSDSGSFLGPMADALGSIAGIDASNMSELEIIFYGIGVAVGILAGIVMLAAAPFVALYAVIMRGPILLGEVFSSIGATISGWWTSFKDTVSSIGTGIIDGIVGGIKAGMFSVTGAITAVVKAAVKAAKSWLGISSPSKVFMGIGAYASEGMELGIKSGTKDVSSAASSMIDPARIGGGGGTTNVSAPTKMSITVPDAGDPAATAAAVSSALEAKVVGMFERAAIQVAVVGASA